MRQLYFEIYNFFDKLQIIRGNFRFDYSPNPIGAEKFKNTISSLSSWSHAFFTFQRSPRFISVLPLLPTTPAGRVIVAIVGNNV